MKEKAVKYLKKLGFKQAEGEGKDTWDMFLNTETGEGLVTIYLGKEVIMFVSPVKGKRHSKSINLSRLIKLNRRVKK